ncbi:hypothetical protein KGQ19_00705 [Catenulispora sp. NL8]|uniref:Lipoprotein n=1 Tax=Catenulispora pinistramenti TaxID=2705254 RepID=A0ABS5KGM3_9ACTN|nr:hypothetical protein [Catenulispora pinistramenti]MBS2545379.1 hypothetical protein [Catenulispora pinistramenti]
MISNRRSTAAVVAALMAVLTMATACGGSKGAPVAVAATSDVPSSITPSSATPSATTTSANDSADRTEVLVDYNKMIAVWVGMLDSGFLDFSISLYTNSTVAYKIRGELNQANTGGLIYKGSPKSSPTIASINLTANPPTATVHDCFDSRGWTPFLKSDPSKSALAPGQTIVPHPLTATLNKVAVKPQSPSTGGWVVTDYSIDTDHTC